MWPPGRRRQAQAPASQKQQLNRSLSQSRFCQIATPIPSQHTLPSDGLLLPGTKLREGPLCVIRSACAIACRHARRAFGRQTNSGRWDASPEECVYLLVRPPFRGVSFIERTQMKTNSQRESLFVSSLSAGFKRPIHSIGACSFCLCVSSSLLVSRLVLQPAE